MSQELVTITVDGKQVQVPKGMLLVEATKRANVEVPVFCYHEKLDPAGVCRMCLVEVEGQRKPVTACTMPVSDGMVVKTDTPLVKQLQQGVIEFLLVDHPLDCPVCDKGGECPLQDNTYGWGKPSSRSLDPKLRKRKAVDLGQFIVLDEERCILCRRCTRFDEEISQENNLVVAERAHLNVITTADGESFDSYFSGNTIELCPVGALTSDLYRFKSRPWDLSRVPAVCTGCSVGCNVFLDYRFGNLLRVVSNDNPELDGGWLCDRGRFNYQYVHDESRLTSPMIRKDGQLVETTWEEALAEIALKIRTIKRDHGGEAVGGIGGGRLTNEDAYLFQKMIRTIFESPHIDWRVGEQYVASSEQFPGKISDISRADGVLLVDVLPAERAPVIDLRIRRVAERGGAKLAAVGPAMPTYRPECHEFPAVIDDIPALLQGDDVLATFQGAKRVVVVWSGREPRVGDALIGWMERLQASGAEVHLLIPGEQTNARGVEALGVHPQMLPGFRSVDDEAARMEIEQAWQTSLSAQSGLSTREMLSQAIGGQMQALYLASANLLNTFPDRHLAREALEKVPFLIVQDLFLTETAELADVVLPAVAFPEKTGSYTACDGTVQHVKQSMRAADGAKDDGMIFAAVAQALGMKLVQSDQELAWEIQHLVGDGEQEGAIQAGAPASMMKDEADTAKAGQTATRDGSESDFLLVPVEKLYAGGGTAYFDQGLRRARPKALAVLNSDDAARVGLSEGDSIHLSHQDVTIEYTVQLDHKVIPGTIQVPKGLLEAPSNALGSGRVLVHLSKLLAQEVS